MARDRGARLILTGVRIRLLAALLGFVLLASACGDDSDGGDNGSSAAQSGEADGSLPAADDPDTDSGAAADDTAPLDDAAGSGTDGSDDGGSDMNVFDFGPDEDDQSGPLGDGSLGVVTVGAGEMIQIRTLQAISGQVAFLGVPMVHASRLAVDDYGPIRGFEVNLGESFDDMCSAEGGRAGAEAIVAEPSVIGVIGTSCSGAAVEASPLITGAGMVLISGSNTSPSLTWDLVRDPGPDYHAGYYRTAHNDLYQGAALAQFVTEELGVSRAAALHDGDAYSQGLAQAFADAFAAEGGTVTGVVTVNKDETDMVPALTEIAAGEPGALFFPLFQPAGDFVVEQASGVPGLENTALLSADSLLTDNFLALRAARGVYLSGPDVRFGDNVNQSTSRSATGLAADYRDTYGGDQTIPFGAHGYDATVLLLDAIMAASWVGRDGDLKIDRQGVRDYLNSVSGYQGMIGTLQCHEFGDCGPALITVVQNLGGEENLDASRNNVVFSYAPGTAGSGSEGLPLAEAMADGLADVCPSPLVVQTDWFPESEHGALYELIGDGYVVDVANKVVRGSMVLDGVELGIDWEIRTGGPAIGFSPVSQHMAADDSIHLGYASTDQQIDHWDVAPLVSVVAPLERNPQMVMWDPQTYPDVTGLADLGTQGITINVFGGGTFPEVFVAQGIWSADQVDPSYDGSPARFVSEGGAIAQQGFASSEVYTYEHAHEQWGRPVAFELLHDAGFEIYSQTIGVRPADMETLRPCLERMVPIIQQATVDFVVDPDRANAIIIDAVERFEDFWVYPPDLADFSVQAQIAYGLVGDGGDDIAGNMVGERIAKVLDDMRAAGMDVDADLTADQLYTNEFIDARIGHGF